MCHNHELNSDICQFFLCGAFPSVVIVLTAFIGILTMVVFWGVEMARGMSQSPGRRADEDAGG